MNIASIGIDLGKTTFHLVALENVTKFWFARSSPVTQLLAYTANHLTGALSDEFVFVRVPLATLHANTLL